MTALPSEHLAHANQQHCARRSKPKADPQIAVRLRDISVQVYCKRLGTKESERMLINDNDGGTKMRGRAAHLDPIVRAVLEVLKVEM